MLLLTLLVLALLVVVMSPAPDFPPIRAVLACGVVPSDGVEVGQHLLEDGVLGEVVPVLVLGHGVGEGQEVLEMHLHLLLGLLDLAARGHAHPRNLLPSHLGGKGDEPGHQS